MVMEAVALKVKAEDDKAAEYKVKRDWKKDRSSLDHLR